MLSRVLVANRGEIALRILRACRELGIETVAVYSEADRNEPYLQLANRAICIGGSPPGESYLKADRIIAAAEVANVDAIHPGYGFLAENASFAEQCRASKIEFIGPSAEAMRSLGNKAEARAMAKKCNVPCVPGSDGVIEDDAQAIKLAADMGYPVMVKASAGGGGRGMRIAHNEANLRGALRQARLEAEKAFKDNSIYLEKFIEMPRHVEVQVLGDNAGNIVHLHERDCSLQRRHQKLVEETPSPGITARTRAEICKSAVRLAKAAKYFSAGTVEFLVDKDQKFYFIEMNTRIQVEHPVTEMVTGIDLIQWQLRIAAGESLTFKQRDVKPQGAAIECRINAEDPDNEFRASPGPIDDFASPGGFGVRVDTHMRVGGFISPYYDSMIAKLIVHKPDRDQAIRCMRRCLDEFTVGPVKTTIPLFRKVFNHTHFIKGTVDTGFIERTW